MTSARRDDFSEPTKRVLAERAAYLCSNPKCRSLTVAPHSHPGKSLKDGIAAHICAAAPDGPRYDPNQTSEERKNIDNGIWLCHNCSDRVDKDEQSFTKDVLIQWKQQHETFVRQDGGVPLLPHIEIFTLAGLSIPSVGSFTIDAEQVERLRENVLCIENRSGKILNYFQACIHFPEPVWQCEIFDHPPGENIVCQPDVTNFVAYAFGEGASVTGMGNRLVYDYKLRLGSLPPRSRLEVHFFCFKPREVWSAFQPHIDGEFQFPLLGEYLQRNFTVSMHFDELTRTISSSACEDFR